MLIEAPSRSELTTSPNNNFSDSTLSQSRNFAYNARIDHLRFFASLLIIMHHSASSFVCSAVNAASINWTSCSEAIGRTGGITFLTKAWLFEGHTAVALFLTLSGFLFARICHGKFITYKGFFYNRILRIYPLYLAALAIPFFAAPGGNSFERLLSSIFFLQNVDGIQHPFMTSHLWTIAVEFQFYLLFPLLLSQHREEGNKFLLKLICLTTLIRVLLFCYTGNVRDFSYMTIFGRLDQFLTGMLFGFSFHKYQSYLRHPAALISTTITVSAGLLLFHCLGGFEFSVRSPLWIIYPTLESLIWGSFIATYCACSWGLSSKISKLLSVLGALSFSLYINHFFISRLAPTLLVSPLAKMYESTFSKQMEGSMLVWSSLLFALLIVFPLTLGLSWMTYNIIEKPFLRLRVKYLKDNVQVAT